MLLNTIHLKRRNWISGWLISFNILTTTKIIIFLDKFQLWSRCSGQAWRKHEGQRFTFIVFTLYFILKSAKLSLLGKKYNNALKSKDWVWYSCLFLYNCIHLQNRHCIIKITSKSKFYSIIMKHHTYFSKGFKIRKKYRK